VNTTVYPSGEWKTRHWLGDGGEGGTGEREEGGGVEVPSLLVQMQVAELVHHAADGCVHGGCLRWSATLVE
jgi:hypothetical protein